MSGSHSLILDRPVVCKENSKFIDPEIPTSIARGEAECNSWYREVNKLTIPRISS